MLDNIFQTNTRESLTYFSASFVIWFVCLGLLPSIIIYNIKLKRPQWLKETARCFLSFLLSLGLVISIGIFYYQSFVTTLRNHHELQKMITPVNLLYSLGHYVNDTYLQKPQPYQKLGLDATQQRPNAITKPQIIMLVIGETARSQNYQSYHYPRDTNAFTQALGLLSFQHTTSCGTATAVSLPCLFSTLTRENFSNTVADNQDNLLDIIKRVGVNTVWFDNNTGCKGVCKNITTIETNPNENNLDEVLLDPIQKTLNNLPSKDTLIVVHLLGSHGPDYYHRYPKAHLHYTPDCERNDIQHCSRDALINTYDNTIRYSDFMVSEFIRLLKQKQGQYDTSLIYISDHGESLGEHGLYLHGTPYALAPIQQTHIPFMAWLPDNVINAQQLNQQCLKEKALHAHMSHDNIFHSMLGLLHIETALYQPKLDIFANCRDLTPSTSHGLSAGSSDL